MSTHDVDRDSEQEVDLARYWHTVVARWWLALVGLLAGAVLGYLVSLGGGQVWNASTTVYLGASYSAIGGILLQGPQANPSTVNTIARAQDSIAEAAHQAGMSPGELRGNISTKTISTGVGTSTIRTTANPLVRLTVQASTRRKAQVAADALSSIVVERLAGYADRKIETLKAQISADQGQIDAIRRQARGSSDPTSKAVLGVELGDILSDQLQAKQLLIQAQEVERPKVLTYAAAVRTTARGKRNSIVVGAFIGLLVGLAAALLWDRLPRRRPVR